MKMKKKMIELIHSQTGTSDFFKHKNVTEHKIDHTL